MFSAEALIGSEHTRRYDDAGEPVLTPMEKILLQLRWFDWVSSDSLSIALGIVDMSKHDRNKYRAALSRLVKAGRVDRMKIGPAEWLYRLSSAQPTMRCVPEHEYDEHGDIIKPAGVVLSRGSQATRVRRKADGLCIYCGLAETPIGRSGCDTCRAIRRQSPGQQRLKSGGDVQLARANKCRRCSADREPGRVKCKKHIADDRTRKQRQREKKRAA